MDLFVQKFSVDFNGNRVLSLLNSMDSFLDVIRIKS